MKKKFLTGTVSSITGIPKQTLIYYDKIGLLKPESYNNGYRGYSYEDLEKLDVIMSLKETGLSLKDITEFMKETSLDQSIQVFENQSEKLKNHIEYLKTIQTRIDFRVKELKNIKEKTLTKEILVKEMPERYIIEFPIEDDEELSFGYALKSMRDYLMAEDMYKKYAHVVEGVTLDESCIRNKQFESISSVFVFIDHYDNKPYERRIEKGTYIVKQHHGTYDTTEETYKDLMAYINKHQYMITGQALEVSILNYWSTGKEENYVTEIQIPVK